MRKSIVFYKSWKETIDELETDEQKLALYEIIFNYAFKDEVPETGIMKALFVNVKIMMDKATRRHDVAVANGKRGGNPKLKAKSVKKKEVLVNQTEANESKPKQTKAKPNLYVYVDVYGDKYEYNKKQYYNALFEEVWSMYPKKDGKVSACKHYSRYLDKGLDHEKTKGLIKRHVELVIQPKIDEDGSKKYIKAGSSYFNQQTWLDEIDEIPEDVDISISRSGGIQL